MERVADAITGLSQTPGLEEVAGQLRTIVLELEDDKARVEDGSLKAMTEKKHHMLLSGPPGTGKSTSARTIASILSTMGAVDNDRFVTVKAEDVVGTYQGEAETNMAEKLKQAEGGVLFLDEAHKFAATKYGRNALGTLIAPMADPNNHTTVIIAGYDMNDLKKVDPGLRSRISTDVRFKPLNADQMIEYADRKMTGPDWGLTFANERAEEALDRVMEVVANTEGHASMRDANTVIRFANQSKQERNAKLGKPPTQAQRNTITSADLVSGLRRWQKLMESEAGQSVIDEEED